MQNLNVLVADDNAHMRAIVATILKSIGIDRIRETRDGAEAIAVLKDWAADVAIVDFRMEPVDGVGFTKHVRTAPDSPNPYLPIIMLTGYADRTRVLEARDAGVTELIVKPVNTQAVISRLNAVLFHPRPFVKTAGYFGPDRRRSANAEYSGPERRKAATLKAE